MRLGAARLLAGGLPLAGQQRLLGQRQRGEAGIAQPAMCDGELAPGPAVFRLLAHRFLQFRQGPAGVALLVQGQQGFGMGGADQRRVGQALDGFGIGFLGLGDAAILIEHLPLQLAEIGIVGIIGDQRVDGGHGAVQVRDAVIGDGPCIARRQAGVACGIIHQRLAGLLHEAVQLCHHALVAHREALGRRGIGIGRVGQVVAHEIHPLAGQRMATHIGRLAACQQHFLAAQLFQDFHHAAAGLADLIQIFHAGLIGRLFLVAIILQQHAARHF